MRGVERNMQPSPLLSSSSKFEANIRNAYLVSKSLDSKTSSVVELPPRGGPFFRGMKTEEDANSGDRPFSKTKRYWFWSLLEHSHETTWLGSSKVYMSSCDKTVWAIGRRELAIWEERILCNKFTEIVQLHKLSWFPSCSWESINNAIFRLFPHHCPTLHHHMIWNRQYY